MFRLKIGPKIDRRFFTILLLPLTLLLSRKRSRTKSNRAEEKERRERQSFQKSRVLYVLSVRSWWLERTRKRCAVRDDARTPTHARALEKKRIGNWNGPQPRKDYEFSQREEFHDASFRRGVKGEKDDDDDAEEDDDDASCFRSGIFLFGR